MSSRQAISWELLSYSKIQLFGFSTFNFTRSDLTASLQHLKHFFVINCTNLISTLQGAAEHVQSKAATQTTSFESWCAHIRFFAQSICGLLITVIITFALFYLNPSIFIVMSSQKKNFALKLKVQPHTLHILSVDLYKLISVVITFLRYGNSATVGF